MQTLNGVIKSRSWGALLHAALVTKPQGINFVGRNTVCWFSWGHAVATARVIQPSAGEGSQREGQSVNKIPLRKGAPLISQQGRLSREGREGEAERG